MKKSALMVIGLAACGATGHSIAARGQGDAARDKGDLEAAIDAYLTGVLDADNYHEDFSALTERIHATEVQLAKRRLAAARGADPFAADAELHALKDRLESPFDWAALLAQRNSSRKEFELADGVRRDLWPFAIDDREALRKELAAAAEPVYDALALRVTQEGEDPPLDHMVFLIDPLLERPPFAAARAREAEHLAAIVERERQAMPGLAAWDAQLANLFGAKLPLVKIPEGGGGELSFAITETDNCALTQPRAGGGTVAVAAAVTVSCGATQASTTVTKTEYETVTERVPETHNVGTHWVTETTTEYDTVVGQEDYDCSTGYSKKVCTRSFERKEPHQVSRQREVTDTETVMVERKRQVPHQRQVMQTTYTVTVRGSAHLTWSGGAIDVSLSTVQSADEPGKARALAATEIQTQVLAGGTQISSKQHSDANAQIAELGKTDPARGLDLALQVAYRGRHLDDPTAHSLAARTQLPVERVTRIFATTAGYALEGEAGAVPRPSDHPGITDEEYAWASALEAKVNTGGKPSPEDLARYEELSKRVTAAKEAAKTGPMVSSDDVEWALALEARVKTGYTPNAEETARYQDIAKRLSGASH